MKSTSDTLYYDGNCPLCSHEIKLLNRFKGANLKLVNIHNLSKDAKALDIDKNELLKMLHLRTKDGIWITGLDATVRAWRHTYFGWLLMPLRWPVVRNLTDSLYTKWANKRVCSLKY